MCVLGTPRSKNIYVEGKDREQYPLVEKDNPYNNINKPIYNRMPHGIVLAQFRLRLTAEAKDIHRTRYKFSKAY